MPDTESITRPEKKSALPDLCAPLFAYSFQMQKMQDVGPADTLFAKIDGMLRDLDVGAKIAELPLEYVQLAKYALAAYFDEMILLSEWAVKDAWMGKPLQLAYFNDFAAGEEFYNKLDTLRNTTEKKKLEVLEVYYLCLTLGFKGKYADLQGMERRKVLIDSLARELATAKGVSVESGGDDKEKNRLSPHWKAPDPGAQSVVRQIPPWLFPGVCVALALLLFLIYNLILGSATDGVLEGLK